MEFNCKYPKDQQLFVYCTLFGRLFWRRTRRNDVYCNVLYDSILNISIYIYIFIYLYVASYPVLCCHVKALRFIPNDRLSILTEELCSSMRKERLTDQIRIVYLTMIQNMPNERMF